jgi:hypothetical protein
MQPVGAILTAELHNPAVAVDAALSCDAAGRPQGGFALAFSSESTTDGPAIADHSAVERVDAAIP